MVVDVGAFVNSINKRSAFTLTAPYLWIDMLHSGNSNSISSTIAYYAADTVLAMMEATASNQVCANLVYDIGGVSFLKIGVLLTMSPGTREIQGSKKSTIAVEPCTVVCDPNIGYNYYVQPSTYVCGYTCNGWTSTTYQ